MMIQEGEIHSPNWLSWSIGNMKTDPQQKLIARKWLPNERLQRNRMTPISAGSGIGKLMKNLHFQSNLPENTGAECTRVARRGATKAHLVHWGFGDYPGLSEFTSVLLQLLWSTSDFRILPHFLPSVEHLSFLQRLKWNQHMTIPTTASSATSPLFLGLWNDQWSS